jgi:hypothetical protein
VPARPEGRVVAERVSAELSPEVAEFARFFSDWRENFSSFVTGWVSEVHSGWKGLRVVRHPRVMI